MSERMKSGRYVWSGYNLRGRQQIARTTGCKGLMSGSVNGQVH
jgi:hypothetical protein